MAARTKPGKPGQRDGRDLLGEAQDLVYQAWEILNLKRRLTLARKALAISPDCADAYVLLAAAANSPAETLELYRKGLAAGERAIGKRAFEDDVGLFWGILETRPYMHACACLAPSLWDCGQHVNWTFVFGTSKSRSLAPARTKSAAVSKDFNSH